MTKKRFEYETALQSVEKINENFVKAKCKVMYTGQNPNKSEIAKDVVEKAIPSIYNIPVVAEWKEVDFGSHGGKIEIENGEVKYISTTKAIGVVSESATFSWETIEEDGIEREYLVIDGIYLWASRYKDETQAILDRTKHQSMEIIVKDGVANKDTGYYVVNDFTFDALCVLGDDVTPCFENASISTYSLDKETFKYEFSLLVSELKDVLKNDKEVKDMNIELLLAKYNLTKEEISLMGEYESLELSDLESKMQDMSVVKYFGAKIDILDELKNQTAQEVEVKNTEETYKRVFEISSDDIRKQMYEQLDSHMQHLGIHGYFYISGVYQTFIIIEKDCYQGDAFYKMSYTIENDMVMLGDDLEIVYPMFLTEVEKAKVDGIKAAFELQQAELVELRGFKEMKEKQEHEESIKNLLSQEVFSVLEEEDIATLLGNIHEFELSQIEAKLFELVGRKTSVGKFSKAKKEEDLVSMGLDFEMKKPSQSKYEDLFEKYLN